MQRLTIIPHGDTAAVVLPASVLEAIGVHVGDVLEATVRERQVILRPVEDAAGAANFSGASGVNWSRWTRLQLPA